MSSPDSEFPILNLLANFSATDSWHDFHKFIAFVQKIIADNEAIYCSGLPKGVTDLGKFNDEDGALEAIVSSYTDKGVEHSDGFGEWFPQEPPGIKGTLKTLKDGAIFKSSQYPDFTLTTINDNKYLVKSLIVAKGSSKSESEEDKKNYIGAEDFLSGLELEENCAIVIDAAAVSILTILKNGPSMPNKIFYVLTPEVVNDPGYKTGLDSFHFREPEGVNLIPCEPNVPESFNYNYSYDNNIVTGDQLKDLSTNPYDKFFSAYNFQLSEVQRIRKGKNTSYTTNLVIKSNDKTMTQTENVQDSKTKNNISFLKSILMSTIKALSGKKDLKKNIFLFNAKFQQKRSGDWLQVLACLVLKSRKLKEYKPPGSPPSTFGPIETQISKVYFITHDRIALAFALLLGVQCIYTHAKTKSCYIFKDVSPESLRAQAQSILDNKISELSSIKEKLISTKEYFDSTQTEQMRVYTEYRRTYIISVYDTLIKNTIPTKFAELFSPSAPQSPLNASDFSKFTAEIFEASLFYDYLLLNYPSLDEHFEILRSIMPTCIVQLEELLKTLKKNIVENKGAFENLQENEEDIKRGIAKYQETMEKISTLQTTLNKYVTRDELPLQIKGNIVNTAQSFQKNPNRKLASGWSWDNTSGKSRIWEAFKNMAGVESSYKSDKNIFLYNLDVLPTEIKNFLSEKFFELDKRIDSASSIQEVVRNRIDPMTSQTRVDKFKVISKSFIAEVFLNFGSPRKTPYPNDNIDSAGVIEDEFVTNPAFDISIKSAFTIPAIDSPLREDSILSENGIATLLSYENENYSDNEVKQLVDFTYLSRVEGLSDGNGKTIDSKPIVKSEDELEKELQEVDENITANIREVEKNDLEILERIENKKKSPIETNPIKLRNGKFIELRNAIIKNKIKINSAESSGSTSSESGSEVDQEPENLVDAEDIQSAIDEIDSSYSIKKSLESKVDAAKASGLKPPAPPSDDVEIRPAPITLPTPYAPGTRRLDPDFELNIKNATYVLLNAILMYKDDRQAIERLRRIIEPILLQANEEPDEEGKSDSLSSSGDESLATSAATSGSESSFPPLRIKKPKGGGGGGFKGGSTPLFELENEQKTALRELFDKLTILSLPLSQQEPSYTDLLKEVNFVFHPLLPIYMIAESLNEISANDRLDDSLDYEVYQNYLTFLQVLRDNLIKVYSAKTPIDVITGYLIGAALKEFLFTTNVYSLNFDESEVIEGDKSYCVQVMGTSKIEFLPVSVLTEGLKTFISGGIMRNAEEIENGKILLKSKIFINYIKKINIPSIFNTNKEASVLMPIDSFRRKCMTFLLETGNIIISDKGGSPLQIPSENLALGLGVGPGLGLGLGVEAKELDYSEESKRPAFKFDLGEGIKNRIPEMAAATGGSLKKRTKKYKRTIKRKQNSKNDRKSKSNKNKRITKSRKIKLRKYTKKNKKNTPTKK